MSRALERFAREAADEVERLVYERKRYREATSELAALARGEREGRLTGAHVGANIAASERIHADEEKLRRRYFPRAAQLFVSDWDGSVITVSPTGRARTVYVPAPTPECGAEHRSWCAQSIPWACSLKPGHDGDHVAMVTDHEVGDQLEVSRWSSTAAVPA